MDLWNNSLAVVLVSKLASQTWIHWTFSAQIMTNISEQWSSERLLLPSETLSKYISSVTTQTQNHRLLLVAQDIQRCYKYTGSFNTELSFYISACNLKQIRRVGPLRLVMILHSVTVPFSRFLLYTFLYQTKAKSVDTWCSCDSSTTLLI